MIWFDFSLVVLGNRFYFVHGVNLIQPTLVGLLKLGL